MLNDILDGVTLKFNDEDISYKVLSGYKTSKGDIIAVVLIRESDMDIVEE